MSPRFVHPLVLGVLFLASFVAAARAADGPDVIVGDLSGVTRWGRDATLGITAYSVGTISCNIGTQDLLWVSGTNQHPVIAQNMFRLRNGRFEQVGMSWLKHGFTALTQNLCGTCNGHGGAVLGVGCSDPYSASLNGDQTRLGPRSEVNASTGVFPYPFGGPPASTTIDKRLQVHDADIKPSLNSGALWFVDGHYVTADDAAAGNGLNNASYRRVTVSESPTNQFNVALADSTQRTRPAIMAWKDHGLGAGVPDPDVLLTSVDVPNDGRFWVASKAIDLGGGTWHYEYAVQNLNSDRGAGSFRVPIPVGASVTNVGFHDVDYHSGEPYSLTDWAPSVGATTMTWATDAYATNVNANALRWGTLYNFRFDCNSTPRSSQATIGLFKPGGAATAAVLVNAPGDSDCNNNGIADSQDVASGTSRDCNGNQFPDECELLGNDCNGNGVPDECDVQSGDCNGNGVPDTCDAVGHDCDNNQVPDECEPDCNFNAVADPCDVPPIGAMSDCDGDLRPDSCQPDCDGNGTIDPCEVASGQQHDCNANAVPDNCDISGLVGGTTMLPSGTINIPIPDANANGISHDLNMPAGGSIVDVNVKINLTHTYDSDLLISLRHGTTTVILANHVGGSGDNFVNTVFNDQASTAIGSAFPPFTGSFRPSQALSAFNAQDAAGVWTILVADTVGADVGTLQDWTLIVETASRPPTSLDVNQNGIPDECDCIATCVGDLNGDHRRDGDDVQAFAATYLTGYNPCADMDASGTPLTAADVRGFVDLLLGPAGGAVCP